MEVPGNANTDGTEVTGKFFKYILNAATNAPVPGTNCGGVVAERIDVDKYRIWNPYSTAGNKRTLACNGDNDEAVNICKSMNIYTTEKPF